MNNQDARLMTTMPALYYDSFYDFQLQIQMEEEPMLPLLSTVATLTLSSLSAMRSPPSSTSSTSPSPSPSPTNDEGIIVSPTYAEIVPNLNERLQNTSDGEENVETPKPIHASNHVACEIAKRFKHCMPLTPGESDLHRAAFNGDVEHLRSLLNNAGSIRLKRDKINKKNRLGCTPIRLAATGGHAECLSLLMDAGASIDVVDVKCQTPLFVAIKNRRLECALRLLQCGAKPEGDPGNSSTPLYVAIMNGDVRYLLLLLEFGADPDKLRHSRVSLTINNPKFTSLNMVIGNFGDEDYVLMGVKALLKAGCSGEDIDLMSVVLNDFSKVLDLLYDFGVPFGNKEGIDRILAGFPRHNECKQRLEHIGETPRSLMSASRIAVIKCLQPCQDLDDLNSLPLPNAFLSYLTFEHD